MSLCLWIASGIYGFLVVIYCFQKKHANRFGRVFSKLLCSTGFLMIALLAWRGSSPAYGFLWKLLLFWALGCSALGDFLLSLQLGNAGEKKFDWFTLGGVCFFTAHILFSVLFILENGFQPAAVFFSLLMTGMHLIVLLHSHQKFTLFSAFSLIYLAALGFMAMSGGLFFLRYPLDPFSILTASGAILFFLSDVLLYDKLFLNPKANWIGTANTVAYFGGQLLFALTIFFVTF